MAYIGSQPTKVVSQQSSRVYRYTATAGQTAFSGADVDNQVLNITPSDVEVHMNGLLLDPTDYTATSSSVTLGTAANAGDELTVTGMVTFEVADTYNKATADARYVDVAGDTMTGALALPSGGFTVGTDQLAVDGSGRVTMPYQPHFLANNYGQAKAVGWQQVDFTTAVDVNVGSHYSTSNSRFSAPIAGVYFFSTGGYIQANNSTERYGFDFRVNGIGGTYIGGGTQAAVDAPIGSFTRTISLNVNDYVEVWMYTPNAETLGASYHRMWFNGYLVG